MSSMSAGDAVVVLDRPWSLAARLTAWYGLASFAMIAAATGFLYWALVANLDREDDDFLADKINILGKLLRERPNDLRMLKEEVEWEPAARQYGMVYIRILRSDGRLLLETPGMAAAIPARFFPPPRDESARAAGTEVE